MQEPRSSSSFPPGLSPHGAPSSLPLARWPQDAPHRDEDYVVSLLIGNDCGGEGVHYRWALHQGGDTDFFPVVFWRTAAFKKEELDECEFSVVPHSSPTNGSGAAAHLVLLDVYFPKLVLDEMLRPSTQATGASTTEESVAATTHPSTLTYHQYRATQRIPAISVYCLFLDEDAPDHAELQQLTERGLRLMLKESFPCNLYRLQLSSPPRAPSLRPCLHEMALDMLFPKETARVLMDAGTRVTTLTVVNGRDAPPRHCQFLSPRDTLQCLHRRTGKLPDVSSLWDAWSLDAPVRWPDLLSTNTADALLTAVAHSHALVVRQALVVASASQPHGTCVVTGADGDRLLALWKALADQDPNDDLVAVAPSTAEETSGEVPILEWRVRRRATLTPPPRASKRLWKELGNDDNDDGDQARATPDETERIPRDAAEDPVHRDATSPPPDDDDERRIRVYRQRHLLVHGVRAVLRDAVQQRESRWTAVERWRHEVLGCRIAKSFGARCFVGAVTYVDRDARHPDVIDQDLLTIHYDDGDVEDFNLSEFYEHLELFIHTSRDDPDARIQEHRAFALRIYEQLPSLTTALERRPAVAMAKDEPADAEVALVVQTAMQEASFC